MRVDAGEHETTVEFGLPDAGVTQSYQRSEFVEKGAIGVAALLVPEALDGLRVTRVTPRGSNADYFLSDDAGREVALLEVGGTDEKPVDAVCREKLDQVGASPWRRKPYSMAGFAVAVRFAEVAAVRFAGFHSPVRGTQ